MKKLTTGQMIDLLGLEDTAVSQSGYKVGYDHKGNLMMWAEGGKKPQMLEGNQFSLYYAWVKDDKWSITKHQIDFEEAFYAHSELKKTVIYCHSDETQFRMVYGEQDHFKHLANKGIGFSDLISGKWMIEEELQIVEGERETNPPHELVVYYESEETIKRLEEVGMISYIPKIVPKVKFVFFETGLEKDEILKVEGVIQVRESGTYKLTI